MPPLSQSPGGARRRSPPPSGRFRAGAQNGAGYGPTRRLRHTRRVSSSSAAGRFRDRRETRYHFLDPVLVSCPRCREVAYVIPVADPPEPARSPVFVPRRMVCRACGLIRTASSRSLCFSTDAAHRAVDPYFGLPLWLQTRTRHGWLWAYNREHLALLRDYVQAPLRERASWYDTGQKMTLLARLPRWIKQAKNRDEILRAIDRVLRGAPSATGPR